MFDDAILDTFVGSRLGGGSLKDSLGSSCEPPNKRPTRWRVVSIGVLLLNDSEGSIDVGIECTADVEGCSWRGRQQPVRVSNDHLVRRP